MLLVGTVTAEAAVPAEERPNVLLILVDALWVHEYGHAKIGYDAKMSIQNALEKTVFEERNCQSLARKLNRMAREIIDREVDEAYDGVTDHGRTQGAYYDVRDARAAVRNYQRNEGQT